MILFLFATSAQSRPDSLHVVSIYKLEEGKSALCENCRLGMIPASAIKIIPLLKLYDKFKGRVFRVKICKASSAIDVFLPLDPTMSKGELFQLLTQFKKDSKITLHLPVVRLSEQRFKKLYGDSLSNSGRLSFFPIDYLFRFQVDLSSPQPKITRIPIDNHDRQILELCRLAGIVCEIKNQLAMHPGEFFTDSASENCSSLGFSDMDKLFRAIGSYSNNFATEFALSILADTVSIEEGERSLKSEVRSHFQNSRIIEFTGLERDNRVTCEELTKFFKAEISVNPGVLHFLRVNSSYPTYRHLTEIPVELFAKTGTLNGVSALVGAYRKNKQTDKLVYICIIQNCESCSIDLKSKEREILLNIILKN